MTSIDPHHPTSARLSAVPGGRLVAQRSAVSVVSALVEISPRARSWLARARPEPDTLSAARFSPYQSFTVECGYDFDAAVMELRTGRRIVESLTDRGRALLGPVLVSDHKLAILLTPGASTQLPALSAADRRLLGAASVRLLGLGSVLTVPPCSTRRSATRSWLNPPVGDTEAGPQPLTPLSDLVAATSGLDQGRIGA